MFMLGADGLAPQIGSVLLLLIFDVVFSAHVVVPRTLGLYWKDDICKDHSKDNKNTSVRVR